MSSLVAGQPQHDRGTDTLLAYGVVIVAGVADSGHPPIRYAEDGVAIGAAAGQGEAAPSGRLTDSPPLFSFFCSKESSSVFGLNRLVRVGLPAQACRSSEDMPTRA
jgi:hypothetical protein